MSLWWINMVILRCYGNKNKKTLFFSWFNLFSPLSIHSLSFPFSLLFLPFFFLHFLISFPTAILSYFPHPRSGIFGKIYKKFWGLRLRFWFWLRNICVGRKVSQERYTSVPTCGVRRVVGRLRDDWAITCFLPYILGALHSQDFGKNVYERKERDI